MPPFRPLPAVTPPQPLDASRWVARNGPPERTPTWAQHRALVASQEARLAADLRSHTTGATTEAAARFTQLAQSLEMWRQSYQMSQSQSVNNFWQCEPTSQLRAYSVLTSFDDDLQQRHKLTAAAQKWWLQAIDLPRKSLSWGAVWLASKRDAVELVRGMLTWLYLVQSAQVVTSELVTWTGQITRRGDCRMSLHAMLEVDAPDEEAAGYDAMAEPPPPYTVRLTKIVSTSLSRAIAVGAAHRVPGDNHLLRLRVPAGTPVQIFGFGVEEEVALLPGSTLVYTGRDDEALHFDVRGPSQWRTLVRRQRWVLGSDDSLLDFFGRWHEFVTSARWWLPNSDAELVDVDDRRREELLDRYQSLKDLLDLYLQMHRLLMEA
jgi:hypothetical protein